MSRHRGEWKKRFFWSYPLNILTIGGGLPYILYLIGVIFFGLETSYFLHYLTVGICGASLLAEQVIRGLIEHRVRKELADRERKMLAALPHALDPLS